MAARSGFESENENENEDENEDEGADARRDAETAWERGLKPRATGRPPGNGVAKFTLLSRIM